MPIICRLVKSLYMRIQTNIPAGVCGDYCITNNLLGFDCYGRKDTEGFYSYLMHNDAILMHDCEHEYAEHSELWQRAHGHVLIAGLGVGMVNAYLINLPTVESVTIIEKSKEVIDLVWNHCKKDERFELINADIHTWDNPKNKKWNVGWFDTNPWLYGMSFEEYIENINKKYQPFCDWIGFWKNNLL